MAKPYGIRNDGNDLYTADFARMLPEPLKRDPKMKALAEAVTKALLEVSGNIENVLIYSRIGELPEELVDILAYDMHIDWYDYSYPLSVKRDILKNSVKVHKKMGTKYAVEKALGALYPKSEVEEWFEYEGEPHHFHIVCDVTEDRITASYSDIVNAVKMYKRLSSHMDEVTYQSSIFITIQTHTDCYIYKTPVTGRLKAGTYPQRNRRGAQSTGRFIVGTEAAGFIFTAPATGTVPQRNTVGGLSGAQIDAETALETFGYRNIPAGQIKAGEKPQRNRRGAEAGTEVEMEDGAAGFTFTVPATGTAPQRNTVSSLSGTQIDAETALETFRYRNIPAGQIKTGEKPQRNMVLQTGGGAMAGKTEREIFLHKSRMCGSTRKL